METATCVLTCKYWFSISRITCLIIFSGSSARSIMSLRLARISVPTLSKSPISFSFPNSLGAQKSKANRHQDHCKTVFNEAGQASSEMCHCQTYDHHHEDQDDQQFLFSAHAIPQSSASGQIP